MMDYREYNQSNNASWNQSWGSADYYDNGQSHGIYSHNVQFIVQGIAVPTIGLMGILGNLLNLAILSWRSWKREDDTLEKVALVGLIALAASDLCFCLTIVPNYTEFYSQTSYDSLSFSLYYKLYGSYVQNVFIKTSTWLTMVVATARYIAICHPLRARICFGLTATKVAIVSTYLFWSILLLPYLWEFTAVPLTMNNHTQYILDTGPFINNRHMWNTFTYMWAFMGYFIPVAILAFCNVCLILALRESRLLRESVAVSRNGTSSARRSNRRITMTLIALVLMFMILVSPSELLHFCIHLGIPFEVIEVGVLVTNVLQAINFAFHFVLYCAVNVTFRRTLMTFFYVALSYIRTPRLGRKRTRDSFSGGRSTFVHSVLRSNETNI